MATLQEFIGAAEYIAEAGNPELILCERGILQDRPDCVFSASKENPIPPAPAAFDGGGDT